MPWLILLRYLKTHTAFWWSWLIGMVFFLASMWWLIHVTLAGWIILCAYLAIFFGTFGLITSWILSDKRQVTGDKQGFVAACRLPLVPPLIISSAWVSLEYLRSHVLSGLGWNLLAYSQTPWRAVIQIADVTGVWGVSFVIVCVNVIITHLTFVMVRGKGRGAREERNRNRTAVFFYLLLLATLIVVVLAYGLWRLQHVAGGPSVRVAVVQGNIPQEAKWDETYQAEILSRYETLTHDAAKTQPALIVWPETSTPDYLDIDELVTQRLLALSPSTGIPLLVGAPMKRLHGIVFESTNSAALLTPDGVIAQRYDKLHLVPFGEFIPLETVFPWLREVLPPIGNFVPGHEFTVFNSGQGQGAGDRGQGNTSSPTPPFSVLICFEDIFPDLARRFVQQGAQLLLVITNDAWFGPTAAAYQHAQASTFRAVELRVPVARAANTGWSGCIDPAGRWIGSVHDARGAELFITGTHTCELSLGTASSLYLRFGDWFAWGCLMATLGGLLPAIISVWVSRRSARGT